MNSLVGLNRLVRVSLFSANTTAISRRSLAIKDWFGKKDPKQSSENENDEKSVIESLRNEDRQISDDYEAIKKIETTRLTRIKAYKPPNNIKEQITTICQEVIGNKSNQDWEKFKLDDLNVKFNLLEKCGNQFNHYVPNPMLNDISDMAALVDFYSTEVKDTSPLEDLANLQSSDLPRNVHVNLEYTRFDPDKDTFFEGKDAYPERNTLVTSLWYSKKYKTVVKKKPYFTK